MQEGMNPRHPKGLKSDKETEIKEAHTYFPSGHSCLSALPSSVRVICFDYHMSLTRET